MTATMGHCRLICARSSASDQVLSRTLRESWSPPKLRAPTSRPQPKKVGETTINFASSEVQKVSTSTINDNEQERRSPGSYFRCRTPVFDEDGTWPISTSHVKAESRRGARLAGRSGSSGSGLESTPYNFANETCETNTKRHPLPARIGAF